MWPGGNVQDYVHIHDTASRAMLFQFTTAAPFSEKAKTLRRKQSFVMRGCKHGVVGSIPAGKIPSGVPMPPRAVHA